MNKFLCQFNVIIGTLDLLMSILNSNWLDYWLGIACLTMGLLVVPYMLKLKQKP